MSRPLNRSSMSLVIAALLGIAQMYLLTILWEYISAYTPLPRWLLTLGLRGTALHFIWQYRLFFTDPFLLNDWAMFVPGVLLALVPLPLAALLLRRLLVHRA